MDQIALVERWQSVQEEIAVAARQAGRLSTEIQLLAVSKFHSAAAVRFLYEAGHRHFAESYMQEAQAKIEALPADIVWHFIGHLQTNKAKLAAGNFALIHGVDSVKLAQALQRKATALGVTQSVLVQVNLAREVQKSGIVEVDLPPLAEFLAESASLQWDGLMLIPPMFDTSKEARPYFAALRKLRDRLEIQYGLALPELSMGMTADFDVAIQEGATMIRIGSKIFGGRT